MPGEHIEITTPDSLTAAPAAPASPPPAAPAAPDVPATTPDTLPDMPDGEDAPATETDTPDGEDAPAADEPSFDLGDGTKLTASQIKALQAGAMKAQDYTRKTQELAEERRKIDAEKAQAQAAKDHAAQQQAANVIDPFRQADQWKRARYQQYVDVYRQNGRDPSEIDFNQVQSDWIEARQNVMYEATQRAEQAVSQRETERRVEGERQWLASTIKTTLGRDEFKLANTPDGEEDVRAHLALTMHEKGEITATDIEAAVRKVHGRYHARVGAYVNGKKSTTNSTTPISRGGGQTRAPEKKVLPADLDSLRTIGRNLGSGG